MRLSWRQSLVALLAFVVSGYLWMRFEATWLRVREESVAIPAWNGSRPLRIVFMADFHQEYFDYAYLEKAVALALAQKPDLVLIGGDFSNGAAPEPEIEFALQMGNLAQAVPTYACLGNHDHGIQFAMVSPVQKPLIQKQLEEAGVKVLRNVREELDLAGGHLTLVGIGDLWAEDGDPRICMDRDESVSANAPLTVVLAHNPDSKEGIYPYHWDLLCSGHTHAGQGKIPFVAPHLPTADPRYVHGLYELGKDSGSSPGHPRFLAVTAGVGGLYGLRFNCRPEIMVITIRGAAPAGE